MKQAGIKNKKAFTLVEQLLVISILALLFSIAVPRYAAYIEKGKKARCISNMAALEKEAYAEKYLSKKCPPLNLKRLQAEKDIFDGVFCFLHKAGRSFTISTAHAVVQADPEEGENLECPSGGVYVVAENNEDGEFPIKIYCSNHGELRDLVATATVETSAPEETSAEPGSDFNEISSSLIELIEEYHKKYGKYPRSWGKFAYTDIGLDPDDWNRDFNGLIYKPNGKRISVEPADGYELTVTGIDGETRTLTARHNWNLWYDMKTEKWYYHNIAAKQEVDIPTLKITIQENA